MGILFLRCYRHIFHFSFKSGEALRKGQVIEMTNRGVRCLAFCGFSSKVTPLSESCRIPLRCHVLWPLSQIWAFWICEDFLHFQREFSGKSRVGFSQKIRASLVHWSYEHVYLLIGQRDHPCESLRHFQSLKGNFHPKPCQYRERNNSPKFRRTVTFWRDSLVKRFLKFLRSLEIKSQKIRNTLKDSE